MKRLLFAVAAASIALAARAAAPPVELVAPRGGAVLEGGRETTIVWSAGVLPAHVEEWEAFLSLDGGAYYAVRITPHLDADTRSFRWRVPNVAASQARILLRVGDERDERVVEFPQAFQIVARADAVDLTALNVRVTDAVGEPARLSGPAVAEWVSGDRRGAELVTYQHRDPASLDRTSALHDDDGLAATHASRDASLHRPRTSHATVQNRPGKSRIAIPRKPRPLLLLTTRLNI